jgi:hypothetical protein
MMCRAEQLLCGRTGKAGERDVTCGVGEEWIQKFGGGRECHIELDFKETELESVDGTFRTTWGWGGLIDMIMENQSL